MVHQLKPSPIFFRVNVKLSWVGGCGGFINIKIGWFPGASLKADNIALPGAQVPLEAKSHLSPLRCEALLLLLLTGRLQSSGIIFSISRHSITGRCWITSPHLSAATMLFSYDRPLLCYSARPDFGLGKLGTRYW
jgi:hypothetical protein